MNFSEYSNEKQYRPNIRVAEGLMNIWLSLYRFFLSCLHILFINNTNGNRLYGSKDLFCVCLSRSSANNFAMKAKRKTLNAGDVLAAMEEMEFERFLEPLKESLEGWYNVIYIFMPFYI